MKKIALSLMGIIVLSSFILKDTMAEVRLTWESPGTFTVSGMDPRSICTVVKSASLTIPFDVTNVVLVADQAGEVTSTITFSDHSAFYMAIVAPPPPPEGMELIPAGTNAGTDPDDGAYSITVADFYMDTYPVTKQLWDAVYNWGITNGYTFGSAGQGKGPDHPVQMVYFQDCMVWCNARSEKEGRLPYYVSSGQTMKSPQHVVYNYKRNGDGYRLPTGREWEYAARGGLTGKRYPLGDTITHKDANYQSTSSIAHDTSSTRGHHPDYSSGSTPYTSPVGDFSPNGYGLYDMCGNVWEWCDTKAGSGKMIKGGSYQGNANGAAISYSDGSYEGWTSDTHGFRTICK